MWVFNAACTVALFVLPALSGPSLMPASMAESPFPATQSMGAHGGSFGADSLVVLVHSLRAVDTTRRDKPMQDPLHLAALAALALALPVLVYASQRMHRAAHGHLFLIPFCGHGPPAIGCAA